MLTRWPDACVIMDGVESSHDLASDIIASVADPDRCIDAIGIPLLESMVLFSMCDFFLMPYSNSASFAFVFEKNGIFHGLSGFVPAGWFT
jgi:hypothetical protein